VRRVRRKNGQRRAALLAALSAILGDEVTVVGADAGLHIIVWLNLVPRAGEGALVARAQAVGLGLYPITPFYASGQAAARPDTTGLVMGYASLDERAIERGVQTLRKVLEAFAVEENRDT
jgi:GntR family transcriptional regulator/MocR family aminotransferase